MTDGAINKMTVVAAEGWPSGRIAAMVVGEIDKATLRGFVANHAGADAMAGTGEHSGYRGLTRHGAVCRFVAGHVV